MPVDDDKVMCLTPTPGKQGTRIAKWKYDTVRKAILKVVPRNKQGVAFSQLAKLVSAQLSDEDRRQVGSVPWYTVTVKLDLEVRGEIERIEGAKPQRIRRVK